MKKQQAGFTLIELVVVIVILGILAATALPKFFDLKSDAGNSAAEGVAAAIASGTASNLGKWIVGSGGTQVSGTNAAICTNTVLSAYVTGVSLVASPTGNSQFNIGTGTGNCTGTSGDTITCSVTGANGSGTAKVVCAN